MKVVKCNCGHFFDLKKSKACPVCGAVEYKAIGSAGNELIESFEDTLKLISKYKHGLKWRKPVSKVYKEDFALRMGIKKIESNISVDTVLNSDKKYIIVEANTTFSAAKRYSKLGRIAVLNFANPETPGGGVKNGAMAQEECLCRSSNLYPCLAADSVFEDYYLYHRKLGDHFYSDRLIYTKDVTVFKDDNVVPQIMPKNEWFNVDVITCAAPYLGMRKYTNLAVLKQLFEGRIRNIVEAARDNGVEYLVLGAFGCGAFKNPPKIVAEAFYQVLCEENYVQCFKQVVFAIKPTGAHCENLSTFRYRFYEYAPDADEKPCVLIESFECRFHRVPKFMDTSDKLKAQRFMEWQGENKYFGKQFSILGDSISTFDEYNPRGYNVFYSFENCVRTGVNEAADTWWDKVIAFFGGELLVNDSWSGSRVTKLPGRGVLFPSACSDERTSALHINNVFPDVIIVYLGTNDWGFGAKTGHEIQLSGAEEDKNERFFDAYDCMLKKLRNNYPDSEIWCCTIGKTCIQKHPEFKFPCEYSGTHIEDYNDIIRRLVKENKCKLIDLYNCGMPYDSIDGTHPTSVGMSTIAVSIIREVVGESEYIM